MKRFAILLIPFFIILAGCADQSEELPEGQPDGDGAAFTCSSHDQCLVSSTNRICNMEGACQNMGLCKEDSECQDWYGSADWTCDDDSMCRSGGQTDGDTDEADTCEDMTGYYDGVFVCSGNTSNYDVHVLVDPESCEFLMSYNGEQVTGSVSGSGVSTDSGKTCTGTGSRGGPINLSCNDGCTITLTMKQDLPTDCLIELDPGELRFGAVAVGDSVERETQVKSAGDDPVLITDVVFAPGASPDFSFSNPEDWGTPKELGSGQAEYLIVLYEPTHEEAQFGTVILFTNCMANPIIRIPMTSQVKARPLLTIDPPLLNFGSSPAGYVSSPKYTQLLSSGGAPVCISRITMIDDQNGAFSIYEAPEGLPLCIPPGRFEPVLVKYHPLEGIHNPPINLLGNIEVVWKDHNDEDSTSIIDLAGTVTEVQPACLEIAPLEGGTWMGEFDFPGPGLKYGYSQIRAENVRQFTISNCGDQPLEITAMNWTMNMFYIFPMLDPNRYFYELVPGAIRLYAIPRGQSVVIDIAFEPTAEGTVYSNAIELMSNANVWSWVTPGTAPPWGAASYSEALVTLFLSGIGARAGLEVLPSKLNFGLITLECCSRPEQLTIYNIGDLMLKIIGVDIGAGSDLLFEVDGVPQMPFDLGGSGNPQSFPVDVRFCPSHEGVHEGRVEITSEDPNLSGGSSPQQGVLIVPLLGDGTLLSHQIDEFDQLTHPEVDILWTVDCSGSMQEEQDNLADNFETFINEAVLWDADLHIGVISCDIVDASHSGLLQGSPKFIESNPSSNHQSVISQFQDRVRLGTNCDGGREAGLEAAHLALSEPLIGNENAGFLRENAKLSIIFVSDEPEQSVADFVFYVDFFRSIKGMRNVNMIEAYAIVGDDPSGCNSDNGEASAGTGYIRVADACNIHDDAHFMSICEESFEPVYENLAEHLFALRNQFFLSRLADPSTILVTIDGQDRNDWTYDEASNSVIFPEDAPPDPGAHIVIEYDTLCYPR